MRVFNETIPLLAFKNTGPGESGKSTILKQFRLHYGHPFTPHDRLHYKTLVHVNIIQCVKTLVEAMKDLEIPYTFKTEDHAAEAAALALLGGESSQCFMPLKAQDSSSSVSTRTGSTVATINREHSITWNVGTEPQSRMSFNSFAGASTLARLVLHPKKRVDPMAAVAKRVFHEKGDGRDGGVSKWTDKVEQMRVGFGFMGDEEADEEEVEAMKEVWRDSGVQYCYSRANEFQLIDSCA
ncbi:UNVERIFIED_CONTAM: Guanine nucleotide-binding protein subunit alpha-15 [Siphonaria sp. JEL0065]|nr:Guanine nucleotide-binding protein subunit alpha-15 [Siphonaria sp. JEL0065]